MQEPFKKPEIPSYIPAQKGKEETSLFRTDHQYDKPKDTVLPKTDLKQPKISQKTAKMKDEVSLRLKPEEGEISYDKQEVISPKKEQTEITTMPKTDVKQYILHEKKGLALATEEVMVSHILKEVPLSKIEERTGALSSVTEMVFQELKVDLVPKTDKRDVKELKKKEIILISEDKTMAPQSVKATSVLKPEKIEDISSTKMEFVSRSKEEMILKEPRVVPVPLLEKKESVPLKKKKIFITSEKEMVLKEPQVVPVSIIEKKEGIPLKKKEFFLTSEEEMVLQESRVVPIPLLEEKEGIPLKKKELFLTSVEELVLKEPKDVPVSIIEKKECIPPKILSISEEVHVHEEPKVVPVPIIEEMESSPLKKKEIFLTAEKKKVLHKFKVEPLPKPEKSIPLIKKEFVLTSEGETEPHELKVAPVSKIEEKDVIPLKKKRHILTSEDKLKTHKLKETPVAKVEDKEERSSKEQDVALQQPLVTQEPKIEPKETEQALVKKKIDLSSKEVELTPQKHDMTSDIGKEKYLIIPKKEVSQKTDLITAVPEKLVSMKMEVATSEQEPQLIIPGVKTEVVEDVPSKQKTATSLKKNEFVPHKKEHTLIPAKDDTEVIQKGVAAAKGTMAVNALSFLSSFFTCFS